MRILAIALLLTVTIAQASLVERKRAGRGLQDAEDNIAGDSFKPETFKDNDKHCGMLFSPPCEEQGCFPGLVLDAVGWSYYAIDGCNPLFGPLGPCRRMGETEPERKLGSFEAIVEELGGPICAPCGELFQLPCPCEDACEPKCSEGLISSSLLNYDDSFLIRRLEEGAERRLDHEIAVSVNLCLPCGALGQPPCPGTDCLPGLVPGHDMTLLPTPTTVCVPCGGEGQPCCCDSSEFDNRFGSYLFDSSIPDEVKTPLLEAIIQGINADPTKCLSGCDSGTNLKCGVDNICFGPTNTTTPAP